MIGLAEPFNTPFFEGSAALPSYFPNTAIGLDGKTYLLDTNASGDMAFRRETVQVVQQRNTTDPRDVLLLPQNIWRQQVSDWSSGAGQEHSDREDSISTRFASSYGIDAWRRWHTSLLPATDQLDSLSGSTWLFTYGDYLAVINGTSIDWWDTLSASVPAATTNLGSEVIHLSDTGHTVTTLLSSGEVWTTAGPSNEAQWYAHSYPSASFIGWAKDYLILGDDNRLQDITGPSPSLIYTHPDERFRWVDACDGSRAIYAVGYQGDHTVIHRIQIKDDASGLLPAVVAATLPDGEIGQSISSYLGFVFIGTDKGVRMARADSNGDLTLGALIPTDAPVYCFEGQDRFVWYGQGSIDGTYDNTPVDSLNENFPTAPVPGLGRMDLTTFTVTDLTPAYANDLVAADEAAAVVRSVVTWQGRRVFSVDDAGVFLESTDLMPAGWLRQGIMSFSVTDLKTGLYQQSKLQPGSSGKVYIDISFDNSGWLRSPYMPVGGTTVQQSGYLDGEQFSEVEPRFVLVRNASDSTAGPTFSRWEIRAVPVRGNAWRWVLPIHLRDDLEIEGMKSPLDVEAAKATLLSLVEDSSLVTLQVDGQTHSVVARDATWLPSGPSDTALGWMGTMVVVVESVR